jgi:hypothetical protein
MYQSELKYHFLIWTNALLETVEGRSALGSRTLAYTDTQQIEQAIQKTFQYVKVEGIKINKIAKGLDHCR